VDCVLQYKETEYFKKPPYCFPQWLYCLTFPTAVYECSFPLHPYQHLLLVFLIVAILTGVRWNLNMILICISFMDRDGDHFFLCFYLPYDPSILLQEYTQRNVIATLFTIAKLWKQPRCPTTKDWIKKM
jgi:hypothetical protein